LLRGGLVGWLAGACGWFAAALVFAPKGHTTSPCGGCRSLFFDRQRKLTKRKPPCREQSNQAVFASVVASYGPECWLANPTGPKDIISA
ncbi:hypothetical protein, partial [Cupriavidus sp. UME77]|uniref:hypothetical protein n=1 Tax=Cupriavidus sp. UME77 TaxID=1862321 RepID=UPI001C809C4E